MKEFEKKRRIKNLIYSKFTILVLLFFLFTLFRGAWGVFMRSRDCIHREKTAQRTLQELNEKKERLNSENLFLGSPLGVESRLRSYYSMGKEGEKALFIIKEVEETEIAEKPESFIDKSLSWIRSINLLK